MRPKMMTVAAILGTGTGVDSHETDRRADDRRHAQLDDSDASGDSRTLCPLARVVYVRRNSVPTHRNRPFSARTGRYQRFREAKHMKVVSRIIRLVNPQPS